ncbi:MAG: histidine kinase [Bacteroidota bacterium]|nr:histidine kinase [Bacteroidota bacterium]
MISLPRSLSRFLLAALLCTGAAGAYAHQEAIELPQLRRQLDSARIAMENDDHLRASILLESALNRVNALLKRDRIQSFQIDEQQQQIYSLRQELQELDSKYELAVYQRDVNEGWSKLNREKLEKERKLKRQNAQLAEERLWREALIRYVLIASGVISLLIGFLVFRRLQDRRRAVELKAQIAEARASALEAQKRRGEHEARKRFTRQLIDNQELERKRIAADLHDGLGQDLLVIKNRITLARREIERGGDFSHELDEITTAVTSSLQDIRRISRNLRPFQLDRLGLTSTLESMLKMVRDSTGLNIYFQFENIDGLFSKTREIDFYRIIQESVNNVVKHAEATEVEINCTRRQDIVECRIRDNGKGFPVEMAGSKPQDNGFGFGVQGMRERAAFLDGSLHFESREGEGTTVILSIPVPAEMQHASKEESVHAGNE